MLFRDLRAAYRQPAAARRIDQPPSLVAWRVLEGRAAGAAAQRLRFLAGRGDAVHLRADRRGRARQAAEGRRDDDRAVGQLAMAIGIAELRRGQFSTIAVAQHHARTR